MQDEMIEEIDREGNTIAVHPRAELSRRMFLHKASLVIPRTAEGKFIISKRPASKFPHPDIMCCAVGGKVDAGETYLQAAMREGKEEAGLDVELQHVTDILYDKEDYKAMFAVFTTKDLIKLQDLKGDPREVEFFKAVTLAELRSWMDKSPESFAPTFLKAADAFITDMDNLPGK